MPGPSIASAAEITQLKATATTMFGADREADRSDRGADRDLGEEADQPAHVAEEAAGDDARADHQADELERLGDRRRQRRGPARRDRTPARTSATPARRNRSAPWPGTAGSTRSARRVSIFCTVRQLSANDGAVSSVAITSSLAPMACRSQRPRTGSCSSQGEQREDHRRDDEHEERHAPAERVGQQSRGQRADERSRRRWRRGGC